MESKLNFEEFVLSIHESISVRAYDIASNQLYMASIDFIIANYDKSDYLSYIENNKEKIQTYANEIKAYLTNKFIYRISDYFNIDDNFVIISIIEDKDRLKAAIKINDVDLYTECIYAGGYNIQQLHVRVLVETKIQRKSNSVRVILDKEKVKHENTMRLAKSIDKKISQQTKKINNTKKEIDFYSNTDTKKVYEKAIEMINNDENVIAFLDSNKLFDNKNNGEIGYFKNSTQLKKDYPMLYYSLANDFSSFLDSLNDSWNETSPGAKEREFIHLRSNLVYYLKYQIERFNSVDKMKIVLAELDSDMVLLNSIKDGTYQESNLIYKTLRKIKQ